MTTSLALTGKTVLLTGAAGFLGTEFTKALSEAGATVIITDRDHSATESLAAQIQATHHTNPLALTLNVTDTASISEAFAAAEEQLKKIDVVINNAALDPKFDTNADKNAKRFENYPEELLRQSLDVNLLGYTLVAQAAVKHMLQAGGGHIINISSIYGLVGPDQRIYPAGTQKPVDYAITKGGVVMLTKWLATTYGDQGIRANTYTLGGVLKGHDEAFQKNYGARTPLGRMARPEEVGGPLVFLASEASRYMTGAELVVDGGLTAW